MIKLLYEISGNLQYSIISAIVIYSFICFDIYYLFSCRNKARCNFVISGLITAAVFWAAGAMGFALATAGLATFGTILGYIGAALIYGGIALSITQAGKSGGDFTAASPTYSTVKQTQTDPNLPLPMLYGSEKIAGNRIWQDDDATTTVKRVVGFAEGEITAFTDIRINDIAVGEISGISVKKYLGTPTQEIDSIIPGANHLARVQTVGSLKNVAYLAITVPVTNDIQSNYNLTTVVQGRKVRVYTGEDTYTTKYSENPAWVLLDFLTAYNGLGLGLNNYGTKNDTLIKQLFDIDTFIESADFCDEVLTSALSGTVSTSGTTVTGTNTAFLTEITNGDTISVGGEDRIVTAITDDKTLTVNSAFTTMTGKTATEKQARFSFNMIFDSQTSVRTLIDEIYRNCRGGLFTKNGKFQFKIDKAEAISQVFTAEDIIAGSEVFQTIPSEEHYDILKCIYVSPGHEWQKIEAFAEIPEYRDGVPIEHSVNMYSCKRFKQASRQAWYYVNRNVLCPNFGEFKTDYRAHSREVGDVIQHYSILMGATLISKVTSVTNDGAGVFTVAWRNYDERLYTDELGSKQPRVLVSSLNDAYGYPSDISSFNIVQNQRLAEFTWTAASGTNITYEIRKGANWESSSIIATGLTGTSYTMNLNQRGAFTYWIKARNKYQSSENAVSDILNVQYIPSLNEVVSQNVLENASGTHTDTYLYKNKLKLKPVGFWQNLASETWQNSGSRYYADKNNKWGSNVKTSGVYVSQIFDTGANLANIVAFDYSLYSTDILQTITTEWRYTEDGITWSDWTLTNTGSFQFRYYQIRITLNNPGGNVMYVSDFVMSIDVPDRSETYTNRVITDASAGIKITYATDSESKQAVDFIIAEPHVLVTPLSNNCYPKVEPYPTSNSKSSTIKLYTNTGVLTTGNVNIQVKGY